jgi:hypothetical protein
MAHALYFLAHSDLPQPQRVSLTARDGADGFVELPGLFEVGRTTDEVERICAGLLAGALAAEHFAGELGRELSVDELGAATDRKLVAKVLAANRNTVTGEPALISRAVKRARAFIAEHADVILRFAELLVEYVEFDAAQLAQLGDGFRAMQRAKQAVGRKALAVVAEVIGEARVSAAIESTRRDIERARAGRGPVTRAAAVQPAKYAALRAAHGANRDGTFSRTVNFRTGEAL